MSRISKTRFLPQPPFRAMCSDMRGFTLLELLIVLVIISILSLVVAPRISVFMSGKRSNTLLISAMIEKTFDDSFINNRVNLFVFHLSTPDNELIDFNDTVFSRSNGVSVVNIAKEGKFTESSNKLLQHREFPDSFRISEAILSSGEKVTRGNVIIPFYPQGYSDNLIIHILANGSEQYSLILDKYKKHPRIVSDFVDFEAQ
ncbi:MAG TPA: prepilin-type N-terminal cleavage/methylation domain-containing protein [Spirochaetota bacterium]|nr:prepilin-type N-terminal cleavage/methylation domain-containing protein [Spirochaetota bacterium]HPQ53829.1 prepilin-type N-terminal cleavage/methylation domain-containing protein [Spirochaetota bacterium]